MALPEKNLEITEGIFVEVSEFRGKKRVDIRRWYQNKLGEMNRTTKGLNVEMSEWNDIVARFDEIKEFVEKNA